MAGVIIAMGAALRDSAAQLRSLDFLHPEPYCVPAMARRTRSASTGRMHFDLKPATLRQRGFLVRVLPVAAVALLLLSAGSFAQAQSLRQGISAFNRQDYMRASQVFIPLAERGDASAQAY